MLVEFSTGDFHHLMGLGKLKDLRIASQNREQVFSNIIAGEITDSTISASGYISKIRNRFVPLTAIEQLFDDNNVLFRYNEKNNKFSLIMADYLLSTPYKNTDVYIFLAKKNPSNTYFCRSFFPKEKVDYTLGQPKYTLLFKEKITISTGERVVQYDRLSPLEEEPVRVEAERAIPFEYYMDIDMPGL